MNPFHVMIAVVPVINHGSFGWETRSSWWPTRRWTCWLGCPAVPMHVHLHAMERPGKLLISSQQHITLWCCYINNITWQTEMKRVAHLAFMWKSALVGVVSHGWKKCLHPHSCELALCIHSWMLSRTAQKHNLYVYLKLMWKHPACSTRKLKGNQVSDRYHFNSLYCSYLIGDLQHWWVPFVPFHQGGC